MEAEHFDMALRWIHYTAGITWIGILYFFNFINGHVAKTFDAATKQKIVPEIMPRALWWFRWGAMLTFLSGWVLLSYKGMTSEGIMKTSWIKWISIGGLFGSLMWFNVWFIIWPNQKKIITWIKNGESPAEMAGLAAQATFRSKMNTYLSIPLIFCMGAATHLSTFGPISATIAIGGGLAISHLFLTIGGSVGKYPEGGYCGGEAPAPKPSES